jgi:hypothetical protein
MGQQGQTMITINSLVKDHAAEDMRRYMMGVYAGIDRLAVFGGKVETIRAIFLDEQPDGQVSDFIAWASAQAEDETFHAKLSEGRESHG